MGAFIFGSVYLWGSICGKFLMDLYKGGLIFEVLWYV